MHITFKKELNKSNVQTILILHLTVIEREVRKNPSMKFRFKDCRTLKIFTRLRNSEPEAEVLSQQSGRLVCY